MVERIASQPDVFPATDRTDFEWFRLISLGGEVYAYAAVARHPDTLELHLELVKRINRRRRVLLEDDLKWLRQYARALKVSKIAGFDINCTEMWPRFCRMFGFKNFRIEDVFGMRVQVAEMEV